MNFVTINWLAVLGCVVVCMVSGSVWYNPKTFFPAWWKVVGGGKKEPGMENMGTTWALTGLSAFIQPLFMAMAVHIVDSHSLQSGLLLGVFIWAGFIAPTSLVNKLFAGHGLKIWAIENGNHLINFLAFGAILSLFR